MSTTDFNEVPGGMKVFWNKDLLLWKLGEFQVRIST